MIFWLNITSRRFFLLVSDVLDITQFSSVDFLSLDIRQASIYNNKNLSAENTNRLEMRI